MELTKQQIQHIDHRLENEGVKYWDIRIEMLDHVVCEVESKLHNSKDFEILVQNAFENLGWNGSFEAKAKSRLFKINKIVRNTFFRKIKKLVVTPKSLFFILLFICCYAILLFQGSAKVFKMVSLVLFMAPVLYGGFCHLREFYFKEKSGYLVYSSFYVFFSILMLSAPINLFQPEGVFDISNKSFKILLFITTILNSIFCFAGILVHLEFSRKINESRKKILSL